MNPEFDSDYGATVMRKAAEKAAEAARDAIVKTVERELANEGIRAPVRMIGAMITACSMLYGGMLRTTVGAGDKGQAVLIAGMLQTFIAEPLVEVAEMAGTKGGVFVHKTD
jgi:hypothetical protein